MSTFDGIVSEFPDIRIDNFQNITTASTARACFLSHVHADHLIGLDRQSYKGPFIFCSHATRELLLRLERYPNRMNFAEHLLERRMQTYRHLKNLLKPIPLETPTCHELEPGRFIRFTLFDANHCPGAVMFLIEGDEKAILYTGDIRSEVWWVNSLLKNPVLLPYVTSTDNRPLKRLNKIYLDTTFASKKDVYQQFPSKASGTLELLRKLSQYPEDTLFYFDAWTFGYEEVWQAVSIFLKSRIHVDQHRYGLYFALASSKESVTPPDAFKLIGSRCGNQFQEGCLSLEQQRIHSCEKGTGCEIWNRRFVRITPVITRHAGVEYAEIGAGGGHGDLNQQHELELDNTHILEELCADRLSDQPQILSNIRQILKAAMQGLHRTIKLDAIDFASDSHSDTAAEGEAISELEEDIPLDRVVQALAKHVAKSGQTTRAMRTGTIGGLPMQVTFPYSRHSSYSELCFLVEAFRPDDIFPCTVDAANWDIGQSMSFLFGHIYAPNQRFSHDQEMLQKLKVREQKAWDDDFHKVSLSRYTEMETQEYEEALAAINARKASGSRSDTITDRQIIPVSDLSTDLKRKALEKHSNSQTRLTEDSNNNKSVCKRKRTPPRGDYWPPKEVDHYSPPSRTRRASQTRADPSQRWTASNDTDTLEVTQQDTMLLPSHLRPTSHRSVTALYPSRGELKEKPRHPEKSWSQPSLVVDHVAGNRDRQNNRWHKHIAASRQVEPHDVQSSGSPIRRKPKSYSRLSPASAGSPRRRVLLDHNSSREASYRQSANFGRLSPAHDLYPNTDDALPDDEALKNGLKQEVWDSVLGNGLDWADIGLVTVNGHAKEEEL